MKLSLEIIDRINSTASNGEFVAVTKARIHFVLGEKNTGYEILENWVDKKGSDLIAINVDPGWNGIRHEERFRIVQKIGLSPQL